MSLFNLLLLRNKNWLDCLFDYKMSFDKGYPHTMRNYTLMLERGQGVPAYIDSADKYYKMELEGYKKILRSQVSPIIGYVSFLYERKGTDHNKDETLKCNKTAISKNSSEAMLKYRLIFCRENERERNVKEGIELIHWVAEMDNLESMHEYGRIFEEGKLAERDEMRSIEHYEKASK